MTYQTKSPFVCDRLFVLAGGIEYTVGVMRQRMNILTAKHPNAEVGRSTIRSFMNCNMSAVQIRKEMQISKPVVLFSICGVKNASWLRIVWMTSERSTRACQKSGRTTSTDCAM